jgi:uncharacterized protein YjgD (DUF1641 family)
LDRRPGRLLGREEELSETLTLSPEEINTLRDFLNFGRSLTISLTSSQIVNLASGLREIVPLLQALSNPDAQKLIKALAESSGTLADLIRLADTYYKSGTIKTVLELVTLLGVLKDALSTPAVAHLAENASTLMVTGDQLIAELGGIEGIKKVIRAVREASDEAAQDRSTIGIMGLQKVLKEPEVQKGIKFLLHFAKKMGRRSA